jgi:DNA-binding IclR family transcriptional regulator
MHLRTLPYDVADRLPTAKASTAIWINNCISPSFVSASVQNLLLHRQFNSHVVRSKSILEIDFSFRNPDKNCNILIYSRQFITAGSAMKAKKTSSGATTTKDDKSRIQSIGKMMGILECFSTINRQLSLAQVATLSGLPRPTAHRMLSAMKEIGFIEQDARSSSYGLGIRLFELGNIALANMDILREAKPFMDRLSEVSGESSHLGVFNGFEVIVVEREVPAERQSRGIRPGESSPAHCTGVGKAMLAFQRSEVIEQVIAAGLKVYTTTTISTPEGLRTELAAIRERGYAIDDSEHQIWVRCVAAPIRNSSGHVFASVSVTGPADRMTDAKIASLAPLVVQTADSISRQIGFEPTP